MTFNKQSIAIITIICGGALLAFLILQLGKSPQAIESEDHHEDEHQEHSAIHLSEEAIQQADIQTELVQPAILKQTVPLSGEITLNTDQLTHVVSPVEGMISEVKKTLGDSVKKGDLLAVLQSRELGELKATYLATLKRLEFEETLLTREEGLWKKGISTEQSFITAKKDQVEAVLAFDLAKQKLRVLGLSPAQMTGLKNQADGNLTRLEIRSPLSGTVVEKHLSLGEVREANSELFVVADMSQVWANITLYTKDLDQVKKGQSVLVHYPDHAVTQTATISYISPIIDPKTRSTVARIKLVNQHGLWHPGLYIQVQITKKQIPVRLAVKKEAIQIIDGIPSLFIRDGDAFESVPITTGRQDTNQIEILSGVTTNTRYVTKNAFILKAEAKKSEAAHEH